jgi:hypothetical protein
MQEATGISLKKIITSLRPIRAALIQAGGEIEKIPAHKAALENDVLTRRIRDIERRMKA